MIGRTFQDEGRSGQGKSIKAECRVLIYVVVRTLVLSMVLWGMGLKCACLVFLLPVPCHLSDFFIVLAFLAPLTVCIPYDLFFKTQLLKKQF